MSRRKEAIAIVHQALADAFPMMAGDDCDHLADALITAVEVLTTKKSKVTSGVTIGSQVYEAYAQAWRRRYPDGQPLRNARINAQAAQIAQRLGVERGIQVVEFYLRQTDAFYVRNMHMLQFCARDCEVLAAKMETGKSMTRREADQVETAGASLRASQSYLVRKHAEKAGG